MARTAFSTKLTLTYITVPEVGSSWTPTATYTVPAGKRFVFKANIYNNWDTWNGYGWTEIVTNNNIVLGSTELCGGAGWTTPPFTRNITHTMIAGSGTILKIRVIQRTGGIPSNNNVISVDLQGYLEDDI